MQWYTGNTLYDTLLLIGFAYAILVMVSSFFGTAAYGGRFGGGKACKGHQAGL
jgi:3-oxo-5-alpha-steroid 4-dehydrogenase 1